VRLSNACRTNRSYIYVFRLSHLVRLKPRSVCFSGGEGREEDGRGSHALPWVDRRIRDELCAPSPRTYICVHFLLLVVFLLCFVGGCIADSGYRDPATIECTSRRSARTQDTHGGRRCRGRGVWPHGHLMHTRYALSILLLRVIHLHMPLLSLRLVRSHATRKTKAQNLNRCHIATRRRRSTCDHLHEPRAHCDCSATAHMCRRTH
jgi:hypothetical protein